ncbi:hypothetical protein OPKNFCMD_6731 [Methylobacterium crusticola]|uniref:Peptidase C14 caspase domain-containing protein n=1 Tax=Methylobacterium crusticola TaxID=1697972 RepID=A0ABQ4R9C9_9HYPH|nr:caspase family protein [Methylobacterium crusticola]GJD53951.1 hypothetical protein OPKNFCMD_6731 [Methylobacterium crusticola]
MRALWVFCLVLAVGAFGTSPLAAAESRPGDRVALLIGNLQYPDSDTPLTTPAQDVRAVGAALQQKGYTVDIIENATKQATQAGLARLFDKIKPGSTALFYFTGYGIQSGKKNYLVPVDGQIWTESDLSRDGVGFDGILAEMDKRGAQVKIGILDAANRNPFERRFRSFSTGLAPVAEPPQNTLVVYSTAPGTMLRQGAGPRSAFADEAASQIAAADGPSRPVLDRVRSAVSAATQGAQVPWLVSTLKEAATGAWTDAKPAAAAAPAERPRPPRPAETLPPARAEPSAKVEPPARAEMPPKAEPSAKAEPPAKAEAPAARPAAKEAPPAVAALQGPAPDPAGDFTAARRAGTRAAFQDFLARYPSGAWAERARAEIDRLDEAAKPAQKADTQVIPYSRDEERLKAELNRTLERNTGDTRALYRRGQLFAIHREFHPALADFDEVIRLNPQDVEALNNRCWVRAMIEELDRALRDCNEALKLRPNFPDALDSRGLVNLKIGLPGMAIRDYDAALRANGKQASSLYGRGLARLRSGETQEGNSDISDALAMDPSVAKEFSQYGIR